MAPQDVSEQLYGGQVFLIFDRKEAGGRGDKRNMAELAYLKIEFAEEMLKENGHLIVNLIFNTLRIFTFIHFNLYFDHFIFELNEYFKLRLVIKSYPISILFIHF